MYIMLVQSRKIEADQYSMCVSTFIIARTPIL